VRNRSKRGFSNEARTKRIKVEETRGRRNKPKEKKSKKRKIKSLRRKWTYRVSAHPRIGNDTTQSRGEIRKEAGNKINRK
jgi:hypothetical protein